MYKFTRVLAIGQDFIEENHINEGVEYDLTHSLIWYNGEYYTFNENFTYEERWDDNNQMWKEILEKLHMQIPQFIAISKSASAFCRRPTDDLGEVCITIKGLLKPDMPWEEQRKYSLERTDNLVNCYNCGYLYDGNAQCDCYMRDLDRMIDYLDGELLQGTDDQCNCYTRYLDKCMEEQNLEEKTEAKSEAKSEEKSEEMAVDDWSDLNSKAWDELNEPMEIIS